MKRGFQKTAGTLVFSRRDGMTPPPAQVANSTVTVNPVMPASTGPISFAAAVVSGNKAKESALKNAAIGHGASGTASEQHSLYQK